MLDQDFDRITFEEKDVGEKLVATQSFWSLKMAPELLIFYQMSPLPTF